MLYLNLFFYPKWKQEGTEAAISWDASGYYLYLPATIIYKDIRELKFMEGILAKYNPTPDFQQVLVDTNSGKPVIKYTLGNSLAMLPMFAIADIYTQTSRSATRDGFSRPYQFAIGFGMILYGIIGLFLLRKILLKYYDDKITACVLLIIGLGTNFLEYSAISNGLTHVVLFCLYTIIILQTIKFYQFPSNGTAILIGLILGWILLIRPSEIVALIIPLLWGVGTTEELKKRFQFIKVYFSKYLLAGLACLLVISLQFIYWYYVTGSIFIYSYDKQGFNWTAPHILNYTMSYWSGWFMYTPVVLIPILGLLFVFLHKNNRFAILPYLFLNFYIVTAWEVWDYGGHSGRAMIQSYVILSFGLAALLFQIKKTKWMMTILILLIIFLSYINFWWMIGNRSENIKASLLTKGYYWKMVGRWETDPYINNLMDNPDSFHGEPLSPQKTKFLIDSTDKFTFTKIELNEGTQWSPKIKINRAENDYQWLRVKCRVNFIEKEWDIWRQSQIVIVIYDEKGSQIKSNIVRMHRFINQGEVAEVFADCRLPENWSNADVVFWNAESKKKIEIQAVEIISFNN